MSRLFAFGCSFTQYNWITWADILGNLFDEYYNYGVCGAGNMYMFNRFIHNIETHKINKNDTVMFMWTNVTREDRFINGEWTRCGNLYTSQDFYTKDFIEKYVDIQGCYERDIPIIHATRLLLDSIGCKYVMMSMVDMDNFDQYSVSDKHQNVDYLFSKFNSTLKLIKPSVHKIIFNYDYHSRPILGYTERPDYHPLPLEHLEYIQKILPEYEINDKIKEKVLYGQVEALKYIRSLEK